MKFDLNDRRRNTYGHRHLNTWIHRNNALKYFTLGKVDFHWSSGILNCLTNGIIHNVTGDLHIICFD